MTTTQYNALVEKIYQSFMNLPDFGLGEMGEARDEAKRIVNEWMAENNIKLTE